MAPLLLLHGALGAAEMFHSLKPELSEKYTLHTLDFSGHGQHPDTNAPFSISLFASDVIHYLDTNGLDKISVFGYSMGGYVAAFLARFYPERIDKVVTLATKWQWDEAIATRETSMLHTEKIMAKVPQLAAMLEKRHEGKDWKQVVHKTAAMLESMGKENPLPESELSAITQPITLLLGDRDKMVSLEETVAAYRLLPNGQMGMLPATPHPFEQVNIVLLAQLIKHFI